MFFAHAQIPSPKIVQTFFTARNVMHPLNDTFQIYSEGWLARMIKDNKGLTMGSKGWHCKRYGERAG